jgi:ACS family tartrate transporter-like MFS transporter
MTAGASIVEGEVSALRRALGKARLRIIPLLAVCYLVAYMDRTNISFAAETMNRDLHFSPAVYGLGAGLFFLSYALCEIPSNWMMLRFGARRWLARIMLTWGLLAGAMLLVHTPWSFYTMRLLLGVAEAGFFPGVIFYLATWFPVEQRARAISQFYIAFPLSNLVMGSVAGALLRLNGRLGLRGWQWLFVVEAAPAVLLSFVLWFALPDGPESAAWLTSEEREAVAVACGDRDSADTSSLWDGLRNVRVWLLALMFLCAMAAYYGLVFSLPQVLRQLTGWEAGRVGFLIALMGVVGAVAMITVAIFSDRTKKRLMFTLPGVALMAVMILAAGLHLSGWEAVLALLGVLVVYYAIQGPLQALMSEVMEGKAKAVAIATVNMFAIFGGFVGPYWMGWMRERAGGYGPGIAALGGVYLLAFVFLWGFGRADRRRMAA